MQEGLLDSLPKASLVYLSLESVPRYHGMRSRLAPATRKWGVEGAIAIIIIIKRFRTRSEYPE